MVEARGQFIPFWFWNDELNKEKLSFQLKDIHQKGIKQVIIHARYGLPAGCYLSEVWFYHIGAVLEEAEKLGMGIWFYDDLNWPSGTAGGKITKNPDYTAKVCYPENGELRCRNARFRTKYDGFPYVDTLSQDATQSFIDLTYHKYFSRFARHFGRTIKGFYHDERGIYANFMDIEDKGTFPFSPDIPRIHSRIHGVPLRFENDIALAFGGQDRENQMGRLRLFQTLSYMYVPNLQRLQDWCSHHHVSFIGHLLVEEDPLELIKTQADPFKALGVFDVAGCDVIGGFNPSSQILAVRFAGSVAQTYGKKEVMAETFGTFGHKVEVNHLSSVLKWEAQKGITTIVPHALYYSERGDRVDECPPNLMAEPYWSKMPELMADFRSSLAAGSEKPPYDAMYFPVEEIQAAYNPRNPWEARRRSNALVKRAATLYNGGIEFGLLDKQAILQRLSRYGRLHIPAGKIVSDDIELGISRFRNEGGEVVVFDGKPRRRLNIWNVVGPLLKSWDYKIWYDLSPSWANRYGEFKGKLEIMRGYVARRIAR